MNWNTYFFNILKEVAKKSKDISTKVGCVIVNENNSVVSLGYNGFPRDIKDNIKEVPERYERPEKYKWTEHAERNCFYAAARDGISLKGCRLFLEWLPCCDCARGIIQTGIKQVIINGDSEQYNDTELQKRWDSEFKISKIMLSEAGVELIIYKGE